jgi:hypothetical protein
MALSVPSESPAVVVKEVDLTGGVPNVQSSTGAYAGKFMWGPVEQRTLVANEEQLVGTFGGPDTSHNIPFHDAAYFLRYTSALQLVRIIDSDAKNAASTTGQSSSFNVSNAQPVVKNLDNFNSQQAALDSDEFTFVARFPGVLGNSLRVSLCPSSIGDSAFDGWTYKSSFDAAPGTSGYASDRDGTNDEVHVAVVDVNGEFTGTKGTVLETYPYMSIASDAKNADGTTNYIVDRINNASNYIHMVGFDSDYTNAGNAGTALTPGTAKTFLDTRIDAVTNYEFDSGADAGTLSTSNILTGYDLFEDKDIVEVDFLIAPSETTRSAQTTIVNDLIASAVARKDCVVVASPARNDVINLTNAATITDNVVATGNTFTRSSYLVQAGNFIKVYDKYNDKFIEIPAASSVAGLMAATDRNAAPWFSPAGSRRGQLLGVTSVNYNPTKSQRDTLYKASVNPIGNIPGQGLILFGDKTGLNRPSAFDRINVRRLFLVLERAIARAAENILFEFNDEFTRAEFVNIVEPVLRDVKGRRGITDFRVIADETVNTPAVIDRNEFRANIFIKPARSINYVTLNFVAVRTGVDFEEVAGAV